MKKIFTFILFSICLVTNTQAQLLYQISGNGLEQPSYIVGTYHLAAPAFVDSIAGLRQVLDQCQQVYGEIEQSEMLDPANTMKYQQALMLPEGMTLSQLFTPEEMERIKTYATNLAGPTADLLLKQMEQMSPSAVSTTFELLTYIKKSMRLDVTSTIDIYLQRCAIEMGKKVGGLETVDFQLEALYKGQTLERQKQMLLCLVDHADFNEEMADNIINCYHAQDLEGLKAAMDLKLGNECDNTPEEDARLIYNRNADWLTKMPDIMKEQSTLFVVGAAHLIGEKGVLNLLREAGYETHPYK